MGERLLDSEQLCFSVIVPFRDPPEDKFRACIRSVLSQTYRNFEIICVNDGSDFRYELLVADLCAESGFEIRIVRQRGEGVSSARNRGTSVASGDYVVYLDADDEIPPYTLSRAREVILRTNAQVCMGYVKRVFAQQDRLCNESGNVVTYCGKNVRKLLEYHLSGIAGDLPVCQRDGARLKIGPVGRFVKADVAKATEFPRGIAISEDTLWNISLFGKVSSVAVCGDIWYWYWVSHDSASRGYKEEAFNQAVDLLDELARTVESIDLKSQPQLVLARILGEINRVARVSYVYRECPLPIWEKTGNLRRLLSAPHLKKYATFSVALAGGPTIAVKYLLCKSGLVLPYWWLHERISEWRHR